jgi:hypothetical protein
VRRDAEKSSGACVGRRGVAIGSIDSRIGHSTDKRIDERTGCVGVGYGLTRVILTNVYMA